jgi:hypothetical protein
MNYLSQEDRHDELRGRAIEDATQKFHANGCIRANGDLVTWVDVYDMAFHSKPYRNHEMAIIAADYSCNVAEVVRLAKEHPAILQRCLNDAIKAIVTHF